MKWINRNDSEANYEDRRGRGRGKKTAAIGGAGAVIVALIALLLGQNPFQAVEMLGSFAPGETTEIVDPSRMNENEELKVFTLGVFNGANDVWEEIFRSQLGQEYVRPGLVTFTDATLESVISATTAVGDDTIQKRSMGYSVPDSFTHGTSAQRTYWFRKGMETGAIIKGDTFNDPSL